MEEFFRNSHFHWTTHGFRSKFPRPNRRRSKEAPVVHGALEGSPEELVATGGALMGTPTVVTG